jgi:CheY-like chemotaxis protein
VPEAREALALLREMNVGGCICLPLIAERKVLGAVMFAKVRTDTQHSTRDLELAEELGQRLARTLRARTRMRLENAVDHDADESPGSTQRTLLSTFSHELRAPLNAILGWAHILASGEVDGGKRAHALETIERNARALAALIADLLDHNSSTCPPEANAPSRSASGFPELLSGLHALVVEDDPDSSELVETILRRFGADVTCVATVRAALGALAQRRPDVLVSDIGLPDDDGLTLIRRIRGMQELAALPAIALSAYASRRDITQALAAGFQAYIPKPIEPHQLGKIIADVVNG